MQASHQLHFGDEKYEEEFRSPWFCRVRNVLVHYYVFALSKGIWDYQSRARYGFVQTI